MEGTGEIGRFGVAGLANIGIDLSVYSALLMVGTPIWIAKAVAFVCGTIFAFFVNKNWTFKREKGGLSQFPAVFVLYTISMVVNVAVNSGIIFLFSGSLFGKVVGYCCAVLISATINFIGMKIILNRNRI